MKRISKELKEEGIRINLSNKILKNREKCKYNKRRYINIEPSAHLLKLFSINNITKKYKIN